MVAGFQMIETRFSHAKRQHTGRDTNPSELTNNSSDVAARVGTNLSSKHYDSQMFYETGNSFSRLDLGVMKIISPKLQIGGKFMFASAYFKDSKGSAKIGSTHAFIQATGKHQAQNGVVCGMTGAGTLQGSLLVNLSVSKSWIINKEIKISPILGYEYLDLKGAGTTLNSAATLVGAFAEFSL
jgi:hypothetical protein